MNQLKYIRLLLKNILLGGIFLFVFFCILYDNRKLDPPPYTYHNHDHPRIGTIQDITSRFTLSTEKINNTYIYHNLLAKHHTIGGFRIYSSDKNLFTYIFPSIQLDFHAPQAYLLKVNPFKINTPSEAHHYIAQKIHYSRDKTQHSILEAWQTSKQITKRLRGDCEDHAILLADWLNMTQFKAFVECGKYKVNRKWEGHCWVVYSSNDHELLIESTQKKKIYTYYPTSFHYSRNYHPQFRFNSSVMYVNNSSRLEKPKWQLLNYFYDRG